MSHGVVCRVSVGSRDTQDTRVEARGSVRWLLKEMKGLFGSGDCRMVVSLKLFRDIGYVELRTLMARVGRGPRDQLSSILQVRKVRLSVAFKGTQQMGSLPSLLTCSKSFPWTNE